MNIALIGYGNMGQETKRVVNESKKHAIVSISYRSRTGGIDAKGIQKADVAIDFTSPEIIIENIETVLSLRIPLVIGTTGWYERMPDVKRIVKKYKGGLIYGQNFSIGANIFFNVVSYAAHLFSKVDRYDVFGIETHHTGKKDSPSGTAKKLADVIMKNYPKKKILQTEKLNRKVEASELHFASVRGGRNFGRHEIVFDSQADEIRFIHQAWGRRGFAEGAVMAAEFIQGRKGLYDFSEVFQARQSQGPVPYGTGQGFGGRGG